MSLEFLNVFATSTPPGRDRRKHRLALAFERELVSLRFNVSMTSLKLIKSSLQVRGQRGKSCSSTFIG